MGDATGQIVPFAAVFEIRASNADVKSYGAAYTCALSKRTDVSSDVLPEPRDAVKELTAKGVFFPGAL